MKIPQHIQDSEVEEIALQRWLDSSTAGEITVALILYAFERCRPKGHFKWILACAGVGVMISIVLSIAVFIWMEN